MRLESIGTLLSNYRPHTGAIVFPLRSSANRPRRRLEEISLRAFASGRGNEKAAEEQLLRVLFVDASDIKLTSNFLSLAADVTAIASAAIFRATHFEKCVALSHNLRAR